MRGDDLAAAKEDVLLREIAQMLGERLKLPVKSIAPEEVEASFGWLAALSVAMRQP